MTDEELDKLSQIKVLENQVIELRGKIQEVNTELQTIQRRNEELEKLNEELIEKYIFYLFYLIYRAEKADVSKTAVEIELQTTKQNLMASVMSLQRENYNINSKYFIFYEFVILYR